MAQEVMNFKTLKEITAQGIAALIEKAASESADNTGFLCEFVVAHGKHQVDGISVSRDEFIELIQEIIIEGVYS